MGDGWPEEGVDPLEHCFGHMEKHGLHPWATQQKALASQFEQRSETSDAYYYRYFCGFLAEVEGARRSPGPCLRWSAR